jgi:transcriptional regulator with XRE-family HTH domain
MDRHLRALGRVIRERRLEAGLSQQDAAERWGLHRGSLGRLERGQANPSFDRLLALAQRLDLSLPVLFQRAHELAQSDDDG